jgi:hypothetical protein
MQINDNMNIMNIISRFLLIQTIYASSLIDLFIENILKKQSGK